MDPLTVEAVLTLVELALKKLSRDENMQKKAARGAQSVDDWIQQARGNVNTYSIEEAIQTALSTSIKRDQETICRIISVITLLYFTHEVPRGAICGGTLLKYLGTETFPHINDRQLRFAKDLSEPAIDNLTSVVMSDYDDVLGKYTVNNSVDYSVHSAGITSRVAVHSLTMPLVKHGASIFSFIRRLF